MERRKEPENINPFVYHLSVLQNLEYISEFGLIPSFNENRYVGDTRSFVYFCYSIDDVIKWYYKFYYNFKEEDICLLRFKLECAKYFQKDFKNGDFYTWCAIEKEKLEILQNKTESGNLYKIDEIGYQKKLVWKPFVEEYEKYKKYK